MKSYSYLGYKIETKRDHGSRPPKNPGWVVVGKYQGIYCCNAMPGATWFHSLRSAREAICVLIAVEGEKNAGLFWEVLQPFGYKVGDKEGHGCDSSITCGRYSATVKAGAVVKVSARPRPRPARSWGRASRSAP
jgi:hypothetical protein